MTHTLPGPWLVLVLLLLSPLQGLAATLEYSISGLEGELLENVRAHLGAPPETEVARSGFVVNARRRVTEGLQALGYYRPLIDIDLEREGSPWQMQIDIEPGDPVRLRHVLIAVEGEAQADDAFTTLLAEQPLQSGQVLHHGSYEAFKRRLLSLGQRRGYFDGMMLSNQIRVEAGSGTADLELRYDSGPRYVFGALEHDGEQLDDEVLAALQPFAYGDPFDLGSLQQFQSQLQRTGFFSGATVRPNVTARHRGAIPIDLELVPAPRHTFNVGAGFSTDTEERISLTWRTPRINRYGHSQETRLQWSPVNPSGRVTYAIPLTHPLNDVLQLRARWESDEFGDIESYQRELGVRREISGDRWIRGYSLRGLNERWNVDGLNLDNDFLLPGLSFSRKWRRGALVDPSFGFSQFYSFEAGTVQAGSDLDLFRAYANFIYVHSVGERHRLVLRNELGTVVLDDGDREQLAPSLSFFAGGSNSLRGFAYQSIGSAVEVSDGEGQTGELVIGGTHLLTGSLEYQYNINAQWRAAVFTDAGDAFDEGTFDLNYSAGLGVHYRTPVGAVKLELARALSKEQPDWRIHINIGAEF